MIFKSMKKIIVLSLIAVATLFAINMQTSAAPAHKIPTIAVLSDTGHRNGTTYVICGAAADIIATDLINELNKTGRIKAPLLGDSMSKITQKNIPLYYLTFFREYKYNYNIDFVNLQRVTKNINADYIVMVTSGLDIQSNFLKETWWNKLSIAGIDPVVPTYKLTTLITLIDKKNNSVLWQDLYLRDISARNYDLGFAQFSPSYAQLSKIKKYSKNVSQYVTDIVDRQVNPWIIPPEDPKSIEMKSRFLNEGTKIYYPTVNGEVIKQNFDEFKTKTKDNHEKNRQQKEIKRQQNIENVRYIKKQQDEHKPPKKQEEQLFDSIRNNIDDVSNSLPSPKEQTEQNIKPAVDIQPKTTVKEDVKVVKPVMNKPTQNVKPVNQIKPKPVTKQPEKTKPQEQKKELPQYQWNIKNKNLQEIGSAKNIRKVQMD